MARKSNTPQAFPTKSELRDYILSQTRATTRRDIARAFNIKGADRIPMKAMLKELTQEGVIAYEDGQYRKGEKKSLMSVELIDVDEDGDFIAKPLEWKEKTNPPKIYIFATGRHRGRRAPSLGVGDRALVRVRPLGKNTLEGTIVQKVVKTIEQQIVGQFVASRRGGWIEPSDRRLPAKFTVEPEHTNDALDGDLVIGEVSPSAPLRFPVAKIKKVLGRADDPRLFSLISEIEQNLPNKFSSEDLKQAEQAQLPPFQNREDLRDIPLVTIDGEDARDFDDAVWAAPTEEGWKAIVAIADVAYYVRPDSALDKTALERGNSVYFPDRAIPMLPEALSNEMCSLKPNVDRACLAVHMSIDANGNVKKYKFVRGLMRSVARLTYTQVQKAVDGEESDLNPEFIKDIIKPLYGVYEALKIAREKRGTIDLDLPEQRVIFDDEGHLEKVVERERYDSHRLIEELMIAANVCAASALEEKHKPCMYRIHDRPDPIKVASLGHVLQSIGYPKLKSLDVSQAGINKMLKTAEGHEDQDLVNMLVLRTMAQACYSPNNVGHFGLNLARYCHFTSPIRRYSDILVHRALVDAFDMGEGGLEPLNFVEVGAAISATERRAMLAERSTMDRFTAAYMAKQQAGEYVGKIVGVNDFGLFIKLAPVGAVGFLPMNALFDDYYTYHERSMELKGRRTGKSLRMGRTIKVGINAVKPVSGRIELSYIPDQKAKTRKKVK